jgi:LysM repeat protein
MQFAEAEKQYRELEEKLLRGELSEDGFAARVAELRVLDEAGRRWMLSGRTGRWLVHDGKQWVFAEPPRDEIEPEVEVKVVAQAGTAVQAEEVPEVVPAPAAVPARPRPQSEERQSALPQLLGLGLALLLIAGCLIGGGAAAWVLVLRDLGEPAPIPTDSSAVSLVETYTPRPATPTYTPTDTPTPSRTPTPTNTSIPTNTPVPTDTPIATDTSVPAATPTPGPTRTSTAPAPTPESAVASPTATATAVPTATASTSAVASAQTYTIKLGDTLYEIATSFGVSTAALAEANNITNPRLLRAGQVLVIPGTGTAVTGTTGTVTAVAATPSPQTYTIQPGDTLNEIASRFGVSATALAEANGITDVAKIQSGQVLAIPTAGTVVTGATGTPTAVAVAPSPQTYTIQPGDTLTEIASRFGVSAAALAEANDITNAALIRSGQVLVIPVAGTAAVVSTPGPTPTWTPIVLRTPTTAATSGVSPTSVASARTPSPTPTPSATGSGATATPQPTATPTAKPAVLSGKLAFTVWNPYIGKYELYVSRVDGSGRNLLGQGFRQPQFRQDGNLLAVNGDGAPDLEHLVTMNPSGGDKRGVSQYSEDSFPTWAPDGAIVAFSSDAWGDGKTRLAIVQDMFGMQQDWIPMGNAQIEGEYPFWMADGRIVYHGCDLVGGGGNCGLYWVGAGGGGYHRVTNHESDMAPAGSGSRVAFMSARDGNWEVYVTDINGGTPKRLTNSAAQDGLPTWSPDGKSIAFVSDRGGTWAIWVMSADGSNQRKLFDLGGGYGGGEYDWKAERISWAP